MTRLPIVLLAILGCLTGCFSYSWKLGDSEYSEFIDKECVTTKVLYLNNRKGKSPHAFYVHSLSMIKSPGYEGSVVQAIPEGYTVFVTGAGREKGGDGHVWDYLIGEITIKDSPEPIKFEYLIGLAGNIRREIPFKAATVTGKNKLL